jgi:ABC-type Fe3+-hydroxamate transport system substrate-binding protein
MSLWIRPQPRSGTKLNQRTNMKKTIITLSIALVAPLAFAQTSSTTTSSQTTSDAAGTTTKETTTTTSTEGTVSTFEPGKTIVVRRVGVTDPISYALGKTVTYVNKAGKTIEASMIRPGVPVHVYYDNTGGTQVVSRVVVDQD